MVATKNMFPFGIKKMEERPAAGRSGERLTVLSWSKEQIDSRQRRFSVAKGACKLGFDILES